MLRSFLSLVYFLAFHIVVSPIKTSGFAFQSSKAPFVGNIRFHRPQSGFLVFSKADDGEDDYEDDEIFLGDQDWRAFRAKLVMSSDSKSSQEEEIVDDFDVDGIGSLYNDNDFKLTPLHPSQWAYDSGMVIEQGAVILGGVEQDYGFGLRQQYFHKAAILVLDHDEKHFTKGIILNRPTDLTLTDELNDGVKWKIWFGGDVQGLNSNSPDIVCLHSLKSDQVMRASMPVMNDIQWTTFENAKRLVKVGAAHPQDFWVFCGYAGWGPKQLMGELERKSWYMVATDSQTLLKELARLISRADPRDAGLDTWDLLMKMIGRKDTAKLHSGGFDDMMLKEWALQHLLSIEAGGGGKMIEKLSKENFQSLIETELKDRTSQVEKMLQKISAGCIVRASSSHRSPFLLDNQELHRSIILILLDDENLTIGVILNRPTDVGIEIERSNKELGVSQSDVIPLRYGGQYSIKGDETLLWLHFNENLKAEGIGHEIGRGQSGIFKCKRDDVTLAIRKGLARSEDFIVINGVSVWNKGGINDFRNGIEEEMLQGKYELIPRTRTREVWSTLLMQKVLSKINLVQNLAIAGKAWSRGGVEVSSKHLTEESSQSFDCNNEKNQNPVAVNELSNLADKALRKWVATFLLGVPSYEV
jgi:putative AlgH/UPF0301 family transcriptional regulator